MTAGLPAWIHLHADVARALHEGRPVVALESTVITHGLPQPVNLELARLMESEVLSAGAQPATIAVVNGQVRVGLTQEELERLALASGVLKVSRRDLGAVIARGEWGGTTVAATMIAAHAAGIRVFATGGIGGVHRGSAGDLSADLPELARTPVAVVCAGAKAILDLPRTLEWLETAGVPVIGWSTDEFPAFFTCSSGLPVSIRIDSPQEAAEILRAHWAIANAGGALICVPCPEEFAVPASQVEPRLQQALAQAEAGHVTGKELTPFLLSRLSELTGGDTMRANLALLRQNARVAAEVAAALTH
jgi:pseudouridine-5'-phosphate glycosidase